MNQEEYIKQRMKDYAKNIDEFLISQSIVDLDGNVCLITNKTLNSIEVLIYKTTVQGINHKQWFDMGRFIKRFKTV